MLGIANRLVQAHQATSPPNHKDSQQAIAGRQAEKKVLELLQNLGNVSSSVLYRSLRIPDEFQTRRHEIDLVMINGYGLHCIEVKNWGGKISPCTDPQFWQQTKITNALHSKQIQYSNPISEIQRKTAVLRNHLMRAGICLSENKFFPQVILVNENCELHEDIINDKHVITHDKLQNYATSFSRSYSEIITDPLIPYFFRGQLSYSQIEQTKSALNHIGTWDVVNLNGGKQLVGDFKGCSELSFNRKDVEEIAFIHQRNASVASLWAFVGYSPTATIVLYKRGGSGWFRRETIASITIPYNRDIGFRIAGEITDAKIPANDIDTVILSN